MPRGEHLSLATAYRQSGVLRASSDCEGGKELFVFVFGEDRSNGEYSSLEMHVNRLKFLFRSIIPNIRRYREKFSIEFQR